MRMVRVFLFVLIVTALVFVGLTPQKISAGRKSKLKTHSHSLLRSSLGVVQAQAAKAQTSRKRKVRILAVKSQQSVAPPLLLVPTNLPTGKSGFTDDKQGLDGGGPSYLIPVLNTSTTTTVQVTSVTADPSLTVTTNCATLAPGASCTISMTFTTQTLCGVQTGNVTVANSDPNNPNLAFVAEGFGSDENFEIKNLTDSTLNPGMLASALVGTGVTISNVKYTGS